MDLCERTVQGLGQAGQYAGDRQQDTQNDRQHVDAEIAAGIIAAVDVRAADGVDDQAPERTQRAFPAERAASQVRQARAAREHRTGWAAQARRAT